MVYLTGRKLTCRRMFSSFKLCFIFSLLTRFAPPKACWWWDDCSWCVSCLVCVDYTILIFSHISNPKKRKADPIVLSDSSDVCVFHNQTCSSAFLYVILASWWRPLPLLQKSVPRQLPLPQEHLNLTCYLLYRLSMLCGSPPLFSIGLSIYERSKLDAATPGASSTAVSFGSVKWAQALPSSFSCFLCSCFS